MKIKVTDPILGYDGNPYQQGSVVMTASLIEAIKIQSKEEVLKQLEKTLQEPLTFRDVFNTSLNTLAKDENLSAQNKSKCYEITKKCFATSEPDFTQSQITFLIDRVEKVYVLPLVIGRVKEIFEIKNTEE